MQTMEIMKWIQKMKTWINLMTQLIYRLIMCVTANMLENSQSQYVSNNLKILSINKPKIEHLDSLKMNKKKFVARQLTQQKSMMVFLHKQPMMTNIITTANSLNNVQKLLRNNSKKSLLKMRRNQLNLRKRKLLRRMV